MKLPATENPKETTRINVNLENKNTTGIVYQVLSNWKSISINIL